MRANIEARSGAFSFAGNVQDLAWWGPGYLIKGQAGGGDFQSFLLI